MPRKIGMLGACLLLLMIVSGCQVQGTSSVREPSPVQVADPSEDRKMGQTELEPSHWVLPSKSGLKVFLGGKVLTTGADTHVLQAVDLSGTVLWSTKLPGTVFNVITRSDLVEGMAVTDAGSIWLDLDSGEIIGSGPFSEPVVGEFIWHGDWLLVGLPSFRQPVNPKSPGKSPEQTMWSLYRSHRSKRAWETVSQLTENGRGLATLSTDGRIALLGTNDQLGYRIFEEGKVVRTIEPRSSESLMMLTMSGKQTVERYRGGMTICSSSGKPIAELNYPGQGVAVWGDRIVLSDETGFSVYDSTGHELFHQNGTTRRQQFNAKYLLAGEGETSRLLDDTGRVVAIIPRKIETTVMTLDGRWVYGVTPDGLEAYPVPQ